MWQVQGEIPLRRVHRLPPDHMIITCGMHFLKGGHTMLDAQKMLIDFCVHNGYHHAETVSDAEVIGMDSNNQTRRLVITLYGDIYDVDARRVIAKSNTSHVSLEPYERPTSWTLVDDRTYWQWRIKSILRKSANRKE